MLMDTCPISGCKLLRSCFYLVMQLNQSQVFCFDPAGNHLVPCLRFVQSPCWESPSPASWWHIQGAVRPCLPNRWVSGAAVSAAAVPAALGQCQQGTGLLRTQHCTHRRAEAAPAGCPTQDRAALPSAEQPVRFPHHAAFATHYFLLAVGRQCAAVWWWGCPKTWGLHGVSCIFQLCSHFTFILTA